MQYLRDMLDIKLQCYGDDWIIMDTYSKITDSSNSIVHVLQDLEWIINFDKSTLAPTQKLDYIGFNICSNGY